MEPKTINLDKISLPNLREGYPFGINKDSKHNQRSVSVMTSLKSFFYSLGKRIKSFFVSLRNRLIGKTQDVTPQMKSSATDTREKHNLASQLEIEIKNQKSKIESLSSQLKLSEDINKILESSDPSEKKQKDLIKQLEDTLKLKEDKLAKTQKLLNKEQIDKETLKLNLKENHKTTDNLKKDYNRINQELLTDQEVIKPNKFSERQKSELKKTYLKITQLKKDAEDQKNHIESLKEQLSEKKKEAEDLSQRISSEMNSKLSSDESSTENISIRNRPMMVSEDYSILVSDAWLDVKTFLDEDTLTKSLSEKDKLMILETVLRLSYDAAFNHLIMITTQFLSAYGIKINSTLLSGKTNKDTYIYLTDAFKEKYLVSHNEFINSHRTRKEYEELGLIIDACKKLIKSDLLKQNISNGLIDKMLCSEAMNDYIKKVTETMWNTVIQRPPMELAHPKNLKEASDGKFYERQWNSVEDPTNFQVVCPTLYHNTKLMCKGKVYLYKKCAD